MAEAIWDVCFAKQYSNPPRPFRDLNDSSTMQMKQHAANVLRRLAVLVHEAHYQLREGADGRG